MVSKDKQKERAIDLISSSLLEKGLSHTSLRQLAAQAGISDRMLLYYFKDKADIISTVLSHIVVQMSGQLALAIPANANFAPMELFAKAVIVTQSKQIRPYMRLWIEIVAEALLGAQPYSAISRQIAHGFIDWIENRLAGEPGEAKRATATMVLAMIDGVALLDLTIGNEESQLAIQAMHRLSFSGFE